MAKEWTDEEVQALIRESVNIVKEDREREHYTKLHEKYGKQEPPKDPGEGDPPPPKDPPADPPVKRSLWWGDRS